MAYLTQADEDEQNKQQGVETGGGAFASGAPMQGTAPQGASGGTKQFANIQNYLSANEGVSSAPKFQQEVGGALEKEKQGLQGSVSGYQTQLGNAAKAAKQDYDTGFGALTGAINYYKQNDPIYNSYDAGSPLALEYNRKLKPTTTAFSAQYSVPEYSGYGTSQKFNEYATGLSKGGGTQDYYNFLNKVRGGENMTQGQRALQDQLDVADKQLPSIRDALANQYKQFQEKDLVEQQNKAREAGTKTKQDIGQSQKDLKQMYESTIRGKTAYENALNEKKYDNEMQVNPGAAYYSLKDLGQFYGDQNPYSSGHGQARNTQFNNILSQLRRQYGL